MYVCYQLFSKTTGPNCMRFSRMICHHLRTNWLDFGSNQVKGQGPGHEKVKNVFFFSQHAQFSSDLYETNAKMFIFQFPVLWYGDKCRAGEDMRSTEWFACMLSTFLKNYWTKLHEIFRDDWSSFKDQSTRFLGWSGQRSSRSRSQKSKKLQVQIAWNFQGWFVIIQGPID